jgi:uncharacterized protein (TIGR02466 family)
MNVQTTQFEAVTEAQLDVTATSYFPTQIFSAEIPGAEELNARLLASIYEERERDRKGIQRSNFRSLGGWHSHNNLHKDDRFAAIVRAIGSMGDYISTSLGYHQGYRLEIGTMWSIVNPPGSSNRAHIHPGCDWSGVYYVQAPARSGDIEFIDPRTQHLVRQPRYIANRKRPKACWTKVRYTPVPGKMLIFPSWLYHGVEPNLASEKGNAAERVIISFNLSQAKLA